MNRINKKIKSTIIILGLSSLFFYFLNFKLPESEKESYQYAVPEKISFCNINAPLENNLVYESFDRELIINMYWHSRMIYSIKRANKYFPIIESILDSMHVPNDFKYLAVIESGLMNVTSPSGAKGYWQFLENTAKDFGLEVSETVDERLHVYKSTVAACKYLNKSFSELNDWTICAASYNMGLNGIKTAMDNQNEKDYYKLHLNEETSRYVYRILATKFIFENADALGFDWNGMKKYSDPMLIRMPIDTPINDLRIFCTANEISYKELKAYNPWLINSKFIPLKGKTYYFELPQ